MDSITAFIIGQMQALLVTAKQIQTATAQDGILSQVFCYVETGWPSHVDEAYKPYVNQEHGLSIEVGKMSSLGKQSHYPHKTALLGGRAT